MILFLDFDGVLHPLDADPAALFCCAPHLWTVLRRHPELRVVFSTAWRSRLACETLREYTLLDGGEALAERFIGATPNLSEDAEEDFGSRLIECESWLAENEMADHHWLAIDDMPELFGHPLPPNVYIVSPKYGLREDDVNAICARIRQLTVKCIGGKEHAWGYDGQTLMATRWTCDACGKSKVE